MRISDWSSDVCSSDLALLADDRVNRVDHLAVARLELVVGNGVLLQRADHRDVVAVVDAFQPLGLGHQRRQLRHCRTRFHELDLGAVRSEEHTSELQSLMRIQYAVLCLKKKNKKTT